MTKSFVVCLFSKLRLLIKGECFDEVEPIQRAAKDIPEDDLKQSFELIDRCIDAEENDF